MTSVAQKRVKHLRLVIQDIHHPHNISACLRSAEAFGVLHVHVVCVREKFNPSTVAKGSSKWLRIHRHNDIQACAEALKSAGFKMAGALPSDAHLSSPDATPRQTHWSLEKIPIEDPLALVFGNEHAGLDPEWLKYLDMSFSIPMFGMVESLNISVAAAISQYGVLLRMKEYFEKDARESKFELYLNKDEQAALLKLWSENL